MRKVNPKYNLLCQFENVLLDFIEEKKEINFRVIEIVLVDKNGEYRGPYFTLLVTEDEYAVLKRNKYIHIAEESKERGKAALFDYLMDLGCNKSDSDHILGTSPFIYLLNEDTELLKMNATKKQAEAICKALYGHILKRGFKSHKFTYDFYNFYFSHFTSFNWEKDFEFDKLEINEEDDSGYYKKDDLDLEIDDDLDLDLEYDDEVKPTPKKASKKVYVPIEKDDDDLDLDF